MSRIEVPLAHPQGAEFCAWLNARGDVAIISDAPHPTIDAQSVGYAARAAKVYRALWSEFSGTNRVSPRAAHDAEERRALGFGLIRK